MPAAKVCRLRKGMVLNMKIAENYMEKVYADGLERSLVSVWGHLLKGGHINVFVMSLEKCGLTPLIIRILPLTMIATVRCFLPGIGRLQRFE